VQADTIKLIFTYLIALVVIVGGGLMLYATRLDVNTDLALVLAGFIGSALTFVFGAESATRATRAAQASATAATAAVLTDPNLKP